MIYLCQGTSDTSLIKYLNPIQRHRYIHCHGAKRRYEYLGSRLLYNALMQKYFHYSVTDDWPAAKVHAPVKIHNARIYSSLSHSHGFIALALSPYPVSVDLEKIIHRQYQDLAAVSFSPENRERLQASADPQQTFYKIWTQQECSIKWPFDIASEQIVSECVHLQQQPYMLSYQSQILLQHIVLPFREIELFYENQTSTTP